MEEDNKKIVIDVMRELTAPEFGMIFNQTCEMTRNIKLKTEEGNKREGVDIVFGQVFDHYADMFFQCKSRYKVVSAWSNQNTTTTVTPAPVPPKPAIKLNLGV